MSVWEVATENPDAGAHPCHEPGCSGKCRHVADEYGGLAAGGDYEKWKCDVCGKVTWSELPD